LQQHSTLLPGWPVAAIQGGPGIVNYHAKLLSFPYRSTGLDAVLIQTQGKKKLFQVSLLEGQKLAPMFGPGRTIYLHSHTGMTTNRWALMRYTQRR